MTVSTLAVLGGFGLSMGDGIIGLQALHVGQSLGLLPQPYLYRQSGLGLVDQLYQLASDFAEIEALPQRWPPMQAGDVADRFERVIDIRDFALNPGFRGVAMIDFFLRKLGIDPLLVPTALKRNTWLAPRARPIRPQELPEHYILVCPGSSMALRDMPQALHLDILRELLLCQPLPVVTQGDPGNTGAIATGRYSDINHLLGLVASGSRVISTDTAMIHLADAFDVACLAFFTTHRPEWRVASYPRCAAIHLGVSGIPPALEFSRSDTDLMAVRRAWAREVAIIIDTVAQFAAS